MHRDCFVAALLAMSRECRSSLEGGCRSSPYSRRSLLSLRLSNPSSPAPRGIHSHHAPPPRRPAVRTRDSRTRPGTLFHRSERPGPSRDLYCITLYPAANGADAHGTAQLDWVPNPFTVSVRADGTHRWGLTLAIADLPPLPKGRAPGYMAWATDPSLESVTRLGVVRPAPRAWARSRSTASSCSSRPSRIRRRARVAVRCSSAASPPATACARRQLPVLPRRARHRRHQHGGPRDGRPRASPCREHRLGRLARRADVSRPLDAPIRDDAAPARRRR
jgi:hypothetical protein